MKIYDDVWNIIPYHTNKGWTYRLEKSTQNIILGTNLEEIKKLYKSNLFENLDITKIKKVYFDKFAKFPRFKLQNFTDIKRCLKPENADIVIVPTKNPDMNTGYSKDFFYSETDNKLYSFRINNHTINIYRDLTKKDYSKYEFLEYCLNENIISGDVKVISIVNTDIYEVTKDASDSIKLRSSNLKFVTVEQLDKALNETLPEPTNEDIDTIENMLKSTDKSVVGLGMDLLINYNLTKRAFLISLLLIKNNRNIFSSGKYYNVNFKNIIASLGIEHQMTSSGDHIRILYNKFYETCNEEDKEYVKTIMKDYVSSEIKKLTERWLLTMPGVSIDLKVNVND